MATGVPQAVGNRPENRTTLGPGGRAGVMRSVRYFGGFPKRVMIDNTDVVVLRGTGREMVPVPEMAAFPEEPLAPLEVIASAHSAD